jgi:prepilin-type N-terminal cleavage/methylation domain-containing protein/prepilin-type processing-associated H-X9-DG protein
MVRSLAMSRAGPGARRRAFTLIELLVVIAILGVVTGLVLAAVQRAREAAQRTDCLNRLKNLGLAVLNYESAHGHLPPGAVWGPFPRLGVPDGAGHGLWAFVLPHLEQTAVTQRYRFDLSYDDPANQPAATAHIPTLVCPNLDPGRVEQWPDQQRFGGVADFAPLDVNPFLADIGLIDPVENFAGPLPANAMVRLVEITDGTSNTILLAQACGRPGVAWCSPLVPVGLKEVFPAPGAPHGGGTPACMADGSVHFLRSSIGLRTLGRLATRAGGEPVNGGDF